MAGSNLPEVGASLNIAVKGIEKCEAQVDRLGDKIDSLQDVEIRIKTSDADVRKLTGAMDKAVSAMEKRLASLGDTVPDLSAARAQLAQTFNPAEVDAWLGKFSSSMQTARQASAQTTRQIAASWGEAKKTIASALSSAAAAKTPKEKLAIVQDAQSIAKEYANMALRVDKTLDAVQARSAKFSSDVATNISKALSGKAAGENAALKALHGFDKYAAKSFGMPAPEVPTAPDLSGLRKSVAVLGEVQKAATAVSASELDMTAQMAAAAPVMEKAASTGVKAMEELGSSITRTMKVSHAMGDALSGATSRLARDGFGDVQDAIKETSAELSRMMLQEGTLASMFGPKVIKNIENVRNELAKVRGAKSALEATLNTGEVDEDGGVTVPPDMQEVVLRQTKELIAAEEKLVGARRESSNTMLAALQQADAAKAVFLGKSEQDLQLETRLTDEVIKRKAAIQDSLAEMGKGINIVENVRKVEQSLLEIARSRGSLEAGVVQSQMTQAQISKRALENAQRMVAAQQQLATLTGGRFINAEKTMLADARKDYAYATKNGTHEQVDTAIAGLRKVGIQMAQLSARDELSNALESVVSDLDSGVVPAYGRAIAAAAKFATVSGAAGYGGPQTHTMANAITRNLRDKILSGETPRNAAELQSMESRLEMFRALSAPQITRHAKLASHPDTAMIENETARIAEYRERIKITEEISSAQMKLMALYQSSSDIIGNEAKLFKVARDAQKAGIPIEEELIRLAKDKGAMANNLYSDVVAMNNIMGQVEATNQTQLGQYRQMADTWRLISSLVKQSGKDSLTLTSKDGKSIQVTAAAADKNAERNDAKALNVEKEMAADALRVQRAKDVKSLLDQQYAARSKIVELANKADAAASQEKFTLTELTRLIQAGTEAKRDGVQTGQQEANLTQLRESAMRNALTQEKILVGVMQDENALMQERIYAAKLLDDLYKKMGTAIGPNERLSVQPRGATAPIGVDAAYIASGQQRAADFLGTKTEEAKTADGFKTIKEAVAASSQLAANTDAAAKLENKYAEEVERARTALLAGVQPMENFLAMRKAITEAAAAGVKLDAQDLAILERTKDVQAAIASQVSSALQNGENSQDKVFAAYVAKSAQPSMDFLKESGFDTSGLEQQLSRVKTVAGDALEGSFAAAQKKVADTTDEVSKLLNALKYSTDEADKQGAAYNQNSVYVNRIISSLEKMRKSEAAVLDSAEALNNMTEQDISSQAQRLNMLERVKSAFERIKAAQGTIDTNLGAIGDFSVTDMLSKDGVKNISKAAKTTKTNDEFVRASKGATNLRAAITAALDSINSLPAASKSAFSTVVEGLKSMAGTADTAATQMQKLAGAHERMARNDAGASIFDRFRIYWFMQLRAFWEMYTNVGQLITTLAEYNQLLATTRAVTQGTARDIQGMSAAYSDIARNVPLGLTAIASAALEVAKAGFSVQETEKIIRSASVLAIATGDDLKTSADLLAVIIHAWAVDVQDVEKISNQLFNATAKSRADIEGLASAIGYVAGIAPQANVPLDHALAVMSILTNAGLTMSKAGTYTRQFLNDLMNPSKKLQSVISNLGLSIQDIDPRLNSLENIFKTLASSGMNVADAFDGMNVRAASAFSIMLKNSNVVQSYIDDINQAGAVNEAFAASSDTVRSSFQKMVNAIVVLGNTLSKPFGSATAGMFDSIAAAINSIADATNAVNDAVPSLSLTAGRWLAIFAALMATKGAVMLVLKLFALLGGWQGAIKLGRDFLALTAVVKGTASAVKGAGLIGMLRAIFTNPWGLAIVAAFAAVTYGISNATSEAAKFAKQVEKLKENLEDIRASADKGFEMSVNVQEASTLTGRMTAARGELENNKSMETAAERGVARTTMQAMASYARASSDTALRTIGDQMAKAIPTPGAGQEDMLGALGKFIKLYDAAIGRVGELKDASQDWAKGHNKLVADAADKLENYADRVASTASALQDSSKAPTSLEDAISRSTPAAGGYSVESANKNKIFDVYRNLTGKNAGLGMKGGFFDGIMANLTDMRALRLSDGMTDFAKQTRYVGGQLEDLGMSLTSAEREQLKLVKSAKEYADVLEKILRLRMEQSDTPLRAGAFSASDIEGVNKQLLQTANGLQTLFSRLAASEEQIADTERTVGAGQRTLAAGRTIGADRDPATKDAFQALEKIVAHYADWERNSKVNIANIKDMMSKDPSQVSLEDREAFNKSIADGMRSKLEEVTAKMASAAARGTYAQMFGLGDAGDAVLATQEKVVGEELAQRVAEMQRLGKDDPLRAMNPDIIKAFNKALEDFIKMAMAGEGEGGIYKKFMTFATDFRGNVQTAGGQAPELSGLAKATHFSKTFAQEMSANTQMDTFDTLSEYIGKLREARQEYAMATRDGLISPKDAAALNKQFLTGSRSVMKYNSEMSKTRRTTLNTLTAFSVVASSMGTITGTLDKLDARSMALDETNEKLAEFTARLEAAQDASVDARETITNLGQQMTDLANLPTGNIESLNLMRDAATSLSGNLGTITQQLKSVTGELKSAKKEMLTLKLSAATDALEFKKSYREASLAGTYFGDRQFRMSQSTINDQRSFIRDNAENMDASAMRDNLKSLRESLLSFAKENPNQPVSEGYLMEAMNINSAIQDLYAKELAVKNAEAAALETFQQKLMTNTDVMVSVLTDIRNAIGREQSKISGLGSLPLPTLPRGGGTRMGSGVGALAAKYESNNNPLTIGYDKKGGTSYGTYQFAAAQGTMDNFIKFLEGFDADLGKQLVATLQTKTRQATNSVDTPTNWNAGSKELTTPGAQTWAEVTKNNPGRMAVAEKEYADRAYFQPAVEAFTRATGIMAADIPLAIKQALLSTSVQHGAGGQKGIVNTAAAAAKKADGGIDNAKFIEALYAERARQNPGTASRYSREVNDALATLGESGAKPATEALQSAATAATSLSSALAEYQRAEQEANAKMAELEKVRADTGDESPETAQLRAEVEQTKQSLATLNAALAAAASGMPMPSGAPVQPAKSTPSATLFAPGMGAAVKTDVANMGAAGTNLQAATTALGNSVTKAAAAIQTGSSVVSRSQRGFSAIAGQYLKENWQNDTADAYAQELFTTQINNMKQGLTSIMTASVRDAINGTSDWEDAGWNMIYALIDSWIAGLMNNMMNAMMASMMGKTAVGGWAATMGNGFVAPGGFQHTGGLIGGYNEGGLISALISSSSTPHFAVGGLVKRGNKQKDSTLAALTKGEFVVQEPTVRKLGVEFMQQLNQGNLGALRNMIGTGGSSDRYVSSSSFTSSNAQSTVGQQPNTAPAGRRTQDRPISIVNIADRTDFERVMASPRGAKIIRNVMGSGYKKTTQRSG